MFTVEVASYIPRTGEDVKFSDAIIVGGFADLTTVWHKTLTVKNFAKKHFWWTKRWWIGWHSKVARIKIVGR